MKHPEEFLNRVAVYKQEQQGGELQDKDVEVDLKMVNQFQKAITEFNDKLVKGKDAQSPEEMMFQLPSTEMQEEKYKFTRPLHMSHANLIDIQVV